MEKSININKKLQEFEEELYRFARETLKDDLSQCSDSQVRLFKNMYSNNSPDLDINTVVDRMPDEKLDWAMQQVERTLDRDAKV